MNLPQPTVMVSAPPFRALEALAIQADLSCQGFTVILDLPVIAGAILDEDTYAKLHAWQDKHQPRPDVILCLPIFSGTRKLHIYKEKVPDSFEQTEIPVLCATEQNIEKGNNKIRAYTWSHDKCDYFFVAWLLQPLPVKKF